MMNKRIYKVPSMEVEWLEEQDIVTASTGKMKASTFGIAQTAHDITAVQNTGGMQSDGVSGSWED